MPYPMLEILKSMQTNVSTFTACGVLLNSSMSTIINMYENKDDAYMLQEYVRQFLLASVTLAEAFEKFQQDCDRMAEHLDNYIEGDSYD